MIFSSNAKHEEHPVLDPLTRRAFWPKPQMAQRNTEGCPEITARRAALLF